MDSDKELCCRCGKKSNWIIRVGNNDKQHTTSELCNECYNQWMPRYNIHKNYMNTLEDLKKQYTILVQNDFLSFIGESIQPERLSEKTSNKEDAIV